MISVLYITNYADLYGANKSLLDMVVGLKNKYDVNPIILISGKTGMLGRKLDEYGIKYFSFDFRITSIKHSSPLFSFRKITRRVMRYKEYRDILKYIMRNSYHFDIIHSNSSIIELGYYLARKLGIPHVWHLREFGESDYDLSSIFSSREIIQKYQNSCMIAISGAVKKYYETRYAGIKFNIIYNDVSIPEVYDKTYFINDRVNFAIVGAVTENKGLMDVVKACSILKKRGIDSYSLSIVGTIDKDTENKLEQYICCNQLSEQVKIYGHSNDVHSILKKKDVGIMSSKEEAMGRVTVEYMGNYMTVVGTLGGGTPELMNDDGFYYEFGDVNKLADTMQYLIDNRDVIINKSSIVRKRAEKFNCGECARAVYKLYMNL